MLKKIVLVMVGALVLSNFCGFSYPEKKDAVSLKKKIEKLPEVPALSFQNADIRSILKYLMEVTGVSIVLDETAFNKIAEKGKVRVTIKTVKSIPLLDILTIVLRSTGLSYKIMDSYIWISDEDTLMKESMITKTYKLEFGLTKRQKYTGPDGKKGNREYSVIDYLKAALPPQKGRKVQLDASTGVLIVTDTPLNHKFITSLLKSLDKAPQQILFEGRVIEVKDRNFFKSLGLNVSYDSAEGKSVIREEGLEKILTALKNKDNPTVRLLAYGTTTTLSGQMANTQDITRISSYDIKDGQVILGEKVIGAVFEFCPIIGQASIITADIHVHYSRPVGREQIPSTLDERPIISTSDIKTSLCFKNRDTILLGCFSKKTEEPEDEDEGHILFLITIKVQDITQ